MGEPGAGAAPAWRTHFSIPIVQQKECEFPKLATHGPAGDIRSRGVTDSCMPPCEGGGLKCKSSRERHFQFLRGRAAHALAL